jgi:hypothetical protein
MDFSSSFDNKQQNNEEEVEEEEEEEHLILILERSCSFAVTRFSPMTNENNTN